MARLVTHALQPCRDFLLGLDQQLAQVTDDVLVLVIEEASGETQVAHTPGTSNAVDVLPDVGWQVKVDDMLHVGDVKTTRRNLKSERRGSMCCLAIKMQL